MNSPIDPELTVSVADSVITTPAIDHDELLQRCLGNLSLAERVLDRFAGEFSGKLADLRDLAGRGDIPEIRRLSHQLKGTAANIAAHRLQAVLAALQESSERKSWDKVQQLIDRLEEEFEGFKVARPQLSAQAEDTPKNK